MCDSWECVSLGKSGSSRIRIHCGYSCGIPPHRKQTILCSFIRLYCLRCDDSDFMSHKSVGWSFTFIFSTNEEAKKKKKQFANFIIGSNQGFSLRSLAYSPISCLYLKQTKTTKTAG